MKALLIDGLNLIRRVYAAVPDDETGADHFEGVVLSCERCLRRALRHHQPTHAVNVLDSGQRSWRHERFADYKAGRLPAPAPLLEGMPRLVELFAEQGVRTLSPPESEADDVLATLASGISDHKGQSVILSTNKSMCQLLNENIEVYDHFADRALDAAFVHDRFGVAPEQLLDLLALTGERRLNIPGIHSIGIRTAAKLVADYGDLSHILEAGDKIPGKLGAKLRQGSDAAWLSYELMQLRSTVVLGVNLSEFRYVPPREES